MAARPPLLPFGIREPFNLPQPLTDTWELAVNNASAALKASLRADFVHNLIADQIFFIWATGAQPVPPHMLPVNQCDDFLSLVRKQSLLCQARTTQHCIGMPKETAPYSQPGPQWSGTHECPSCWRAPDIPGPHCGQQEPREPPPRPLASPPTGPAPKQVAQPCPATESQEQ